MPPENKTIALCGLAAVRARFRQNPGSIQRLYFDHPTSRQIGVLCKTLANARKTYRCVPPAELEKISGTLHHGGIVAIVNAPQITAPSETEIKNWAAKKIPLLILDRIGNAHNLGAIARTAAFYGIPKIILPQHPGAALPTTAAHRIAEGGLEHIQLHKVGDLAEFLRQAAAAGYETAAAVSQSAATLSPEKLRQTAAKKNAPLALVLGNEEHGPAPETLAACAARIHIRGSGQIESLNVSAAAAVLIHILFG